MLLHAEHSGDGDRTVMLLHGAMGSSESWWRVAALLAARGNRVIALDLPGHGLSPCDPQASLASVGGAVVDTLAALGVTHPDVAIGHSMGGLVLAVAAPALRPGLAVFVDAPFRARGGWDLEETRAEYAAAAAERTEQRLAVLRPQYGARDRAVEARAATRFDPATAASIAAGAGGEWPPPAGSIVVRAEPSAYVDDEQAERLSAAGVDVRSIPGAAHSVWYSKFDEFVGALPEVFGSHPDREPE